MLEKIGLPAKPSMRGSNWVVDASHCQGCSSQFTFINRKHHCRRCGGLFCNNCTLQRMVLRGQGDSPVRICEPCKQLEEAARFELRYGHKNRAGKGSSRSVIKQENELLDQILGNDGKKASSSGRQSSIQRASSTSSHSSMQGDASFSEDQEINMSLSVDGSGPSLSEMDSVTPEELRQRALDEKKKYKVLKGEGKSDEALKAFKRGKELERQADALEISIRKNRKKALASSNSAEIENKDGSRESGSKRKFVAQVSKEKDDLTAELQQLGWSDMDLHDEDKKQVPKSLESELSSLLGDISGTTNKGKERSGEGNSQVLEHKRRALALKRQGKLAEAKEELKKAKILEKQLEEQELLGAAEDSDDDEISALIRSIGDDNEHDLFGGNVQDSAVDVDRLMAVDDISFDDHMEVTDKDLTDPELTATLKSLGWNDDTDFAESMAADAPMTRAALEKEILSLKREALQLKQAGNTTEAMAQLKKAKKLEKDLESLTAEPDFSTNDGAPISQSNNALSHGVIKSAPKSRMVIQKELLALKKKALALRREGRVDEAEEELKKGKVLEEQLAEMDNAPKSNTTRSSVGKKDMDLEYPSISGDTQVGEEVEQDITDQDMHDPTYLSILRNLGWKDEENELTDSPPKPPASVPKAAVDTPVRSTRRSKAEVQRELLGLKRKALGLRREGKIDEADEVLRLAKILETEIVEMEAPKAPALASNRPTDDIVKLPNVTVEEDEVEDDVTEKDMHDQALLSMLQSVGWKDEDQEAVNVQKTSNQTVSDSSVNSSAVSSVIKVPPTGPKSKREIQRELLGLKRNGLALRRKGETKEAEELLEKAKVLEAQLEELEGTQKESMPEPSADLKPKTTDSLIVHEKKEHSKPGEAVTANLLLDSQEEDVETVIGSRRKQTEDKDLLLGETFVLGTDAAVGASARSQDLVPTKSSNMIDLLTGDALGTLHVPAEEQGEEFTASDMPNHSREILKGRKEDASAGFDVSSLQHTKQEEKEYSPTKPSTDETNSKKSASPNSQNLHNEVLARKRKAVALKREGKLSEAMEELRQAKLLEKSMDQETSATKNAASNASTSMPDAAPIQRKEAASGKTASKPASGRDRFKLQQESLKHKRQAMKLRREGKTEEAEAEFELAKNLEAQLDEMSSQDTSKPDVTTDDVMVEDLLDPQLLSALRAIGIEGPNINTTPQAPERPVPVKSTPVKTDSVSPEKSQLEERIKAEKVKAVNLKRQGKQVEALDALRRAKLYEKKLNSLGSN